MRDREISRYEIRKRLREILAYHAGFDQAVTLRDLTALILGRPVDKLEAYDGAGRAVRQEISNLIHEEGLPVMSSPQGYFLVANKAEIEACARKLRSQALAILAREAKLKKVSLVEVTGQLTLDLVRDVEERKKAEPEASEIPARYEVITKFLEDPLDADTLHRLQESHGAMFMPRKKLEHIRGTVKNLMEMLEG